MWSVGYILYEMCMLKHAFESTSLLGLVYKIVSEQYDPIPSVRRQSRRLFRRRSLTSVSQCGHFPFGKISFFLIFSFVQHFTFPNNILVFAY